MAYASAARVDVASAGDVAPGVYAGSTFNEVRAQVTSDPYTGPLPHYRVTIGTLVKLGKNLLWEKAQWLLAHNEDLTPPVQKLVNPLGITFFGRWKITEETPYSGCLRTGTDYLTVVRCSNLFTNTDRGTRRSFGLAAKVFPTLDPNERVKTANVVTLDTFTGTFPEHFTDVELTNQPPAALNFWLLQQFLVIVEGLWVFLRADQPSSYRPLYPLAQLALRPGETERAPVWIQFTADPSIGKVDAVDFRDELRLKNYKGGVMRFFIATAEKESKSGQRDWRRIGVVELDEDVISTSGDHRLRFRHDPNKGHGPAPVKAL